MGADDWRPSADLEALRARATLLEEVRRLFGERGVLEVETPLLGLASATDPLLEPLRVPGERRDHFLQTSPEFAMKRLLAAGSGPIYQICKAFRGGDRGNRHNLEFTLLEWYRPGMDEHALMDEVAELVARLLGIEPSFRRLAYRELFLEHLGIDPHAVRPEALRSLARKHVALELDDVERDTWLDLLFSHVIEPRLEAPCFIYDYPASQAALARVHEDAHGNAVARRFELVIGGLELANGYYELSDAAEQARRFEDEQARRRALGRPALVRDERLLAALEAGLPDCAGVALGLDRLLMLRLGRRDIRSVLSFEAGRA